MAGNWLSKLESWKLFVDLSWESIFFGPDAEHILKLNIGIGPDQKSCDTFPALTSVDIEDASSHSPILGGFFVGKGFCLNTCLGQTD